MQAQPVNPAADAPVAQDDGSGANDNPCKEQTPVPAAVTVTAPTGPTPSNEQAEKTEEAQPEFVWEKTAAPAKQTDELCIALAATGKLFTTPEGKILVLEPGRPPKHIADVTDLEAFIRVHLRVTVLNKGKASGNSIPDKDLKVLLRSPALQRFLPLVDRVTDTATYTAAWELTKPGYNAKAEGDRIFYTGAEIKPSKEPVLIRRFLKAMHFKSDADRTNALALALTVLLRFMWRGKKPFGAVTANKSHAGKDTVIDFAAGPVRRVEISHHYRDWALQNEAVSALADPNVGLLTIGNIRSASGIIESAFIERVVTSPKALMQSSKRGGDGYERDGDFVVAATANMGRFSPDLANRSLPIDLEQIGDISQRKSDIGDPRNEFLPAHKDEIEAELCGMIENWKEAGRPLDESARHPMREWARTVGGILKANGFDDFLANWSFQRSVNDSTREALALIAHASPSDQWLRVGAIAKTAVNEGVVGALMDAKHRESERAIERQLGVLLSAYREEPLHIETDDGVRSYTIRKQRNDKTGQLATVYMFEPVTAGKSSEK